MASQDEEHMALQPSIVAESISNSPKCQTKSVSKIVAPKMDSKASQEEVHRAYELIVLQIVDTNTGDS
jgi:hypothetical protein